jgi:hypothetical protein
MVRVICSPGISVSVELPPAALVSAGAGAVAVLAQPVSTIAAAARPTNAFNGLLDSFIRHSLTSN